ncbi:MAG: hypothetical protein ACW97A_10475, partial [Candidatus Thorarchaeota archaeon]
MGFSSYEQAPTKYAYKVPKGLFEYSRVTAERTPRGENMHTFTKYRRKSVLLVLSFVLLFMVSSTVSTNIEQIPFDSETYTPLNRYM